MKTITIAFSVVLVISLTSCKVERFEKPEGLIDEYKMSDILYELSIFYSAKGISAKKIGEDRLEPETFIYEKFGIDSTQFANSSVYYASQMNTHIAIYKRVEERLKLEKERIQEEDNKRKKVEDSLREIRKKNRELSTDTLQVLKKTIKATE